MIQTEKYDHLQLYHFTPNNFVSGAFLHKLWSYKPFK